MSGHRTACPVAFESGFGKNSWLPNFVGKATGLSEGQFESVLHAKRTAGAAKGCMATKRCTREVRLGSSDVLLDSMVSP